jgi:hypothetical protein
VPSVSVYSWTQALNRRPPGGLPPQNVRNLLYVIGACPTSSSADRRIDPGLSRVAWIGFGAVAVR